MAKRILLLYVLYVWFLFKVGHCQTTEIINVFDIPDIHHYPFYVALDMGFFKELGLEIKIINLPSDINKLYREDRKEYFEKRRKWFVDGNTDVFLMSTIPDALKMNEIKPDSIKAFMFQVETKRRYSRQLFVNGGLGITSLKQLSGKNIAVHNDELEYILADRVLKAGGAKDYNLFLYIYDNPCTALKEKKIDAFFSKPFWSTCIINYREGVSILENPYNTLKSERIQNPILGLFIFKTNSINEKRNASLKFIEALGKALEYSQRYPIETRQILFRYLKDKFNWINLTQETVDNSLLSEWHTVNSNDKKKIQYLATLLYENGFLQYKPDTHNLYFNIAGHNSH